MMRFGLTVTVSCLAAFSQAQFHRLWVQTWRQSDQSVNVPRQVELAPDGSVYVSGTTRLFGGNTDSVLLKYNTSGILQWARYHQSPGGLEDDFSDIALDSFGNAYWIGVNLRKTVIDKYSPTGVLLWSIELGFGTGLSQYPPEIVIAPDGTAVASYRADSAMHLTKLTSVGTVLWDVLSNGAAQLGADPSDMCLDRQGNVYQVGTVQLPSQGRGTYCVKVSPGGRKLWENIDTGFHSATSYSPFIALSGGNPVVASVPESPFGVGVTQTYGLDTQGGQTWKSLFPDGATQDAMARKVVTDPYGNISIAYNSVVPGGVFVVKYSQSGVRQWISSFKTSSDICSDLSTDRGGNLFMIGRAGLNPSQMELVGVRPNGQIGGTDFLSGPGQSSAAGSSVTAAGAGAIYALTSFGSDISLIKYRSWATSANPKP